MWIALCFVREKELKTHSLLSRTHIDGILPKGPYPPCLRMADRALLAGYPRYEGRCVTGYRISCVAQGSLLRSRTDITSKHRITNPWVSYQIRKIAGCACAGNAGKVFPHRWLPRKPLVSDPGMHHGTCVLHVPWCMSGPLTRGENVPGIPGACLPTVLRIWQEAHCENNHRSPSSNGERFSMSWRHDAYATRVTSAR